MNQPECLSTWVIPQNNAELLSSRIALAVQWLVLHSSTAALQGARVQSWLGNKDPTCHKA